MSQAVLRPNLTKKFQWEVSQIADKERSLAPLYRWFKCKLKPPKNLLKTPLHVSNARMCEDLSRFSWRGCYPLERW